MSTMPTSERFSILKNGIDERLEIIRDNESGFYNITKIAKKIKNLLEIDATENHADLEFQTAGENNPNTQNIGSVRILTDPSKHKYSKHWFLNDSTKSLISECMKQTGLETVYYKLVKGVDNNFKGTYVHKLLFDHFLAWLEPRYAIKISIILDNIHQDANRKLFQEKDNAIDRLEQAIQKQSEEAKVRDEAQNSKIDQLLDYGNKITKQNADLIERTDHLQLTADLTQEDLDKSLLYNKEILNHLVDKSYKSTINPEDPKLITHFGAFKPIDPDDTKTILTRGQLKRVNAVKKMYADTHTMIINTTFNANTINLIINAKQHYVRERNQYIDQYNSDIREYNDQLKNEIKSYNKKNKQTPRIYDDEKRPKLQVKDIPITFNSVHNL